MENVVKFIKKNKIVIASLPENLQKDYSDLDSKVDAYNTSYDAAGEEPSEELVNSLKAESDAIDALEIDLINNITAWKEQDAIDKKAAEDKAKEEADAAAAKAQQEADEAAAEAKKAQDEADRIAAEEADAEAKAKAQKEADDATAAAVKAQQEADEAAAAAQSGKEEDKGIGLFGFLAGAALIVLTLGAINKFKNN